MTISIGIRREDKSVWERRVPLVPAHVRELVAQGLTVVVQPSERRVFTDDEYRAVGAVVDDDLSACSVVFGVKEMPASCFLPGQCYVFFSHTIKGQPENMEMLRRLMSQGSHLIDYERVVDDAGRRVIFFGWYAGVAGMVESLVALAGRVAQQGGDNPFAILQQPYHYATIDDMRAALAELASTIAERGVPRALRPMIVGITGYGNVSLGAQAMLDLLPVTTVHPSQVATLTANTPGAANTIFKAVFEEKHLVRPKDDKTAFALQHYYDHPEAYDGVFEDFLPHLSMLVNCMYWDDRYPRLVTRSFLRESWRDLRLAVIGDIGCDIDGAVEVTYKATEPGSPCYVYDPANDTFAEGVVGDGPAIMAVDILPTELPRDSSNHFSEVLMPFVREIAGADYGAAFDALALPGPVKRALILHGGQLTPDFRYMSEYIE